MISYASQLTGRWYTCEVAIDIVKSIQSADIIKTRQRSRPTNIASMVNNLVQNDLFYVDATAFEHGISMLHSVLVREPFLVVNI